MIKLKKIKILNNKKSTLKKVNKVGINQTHKNNNNKI